MASSAYFMSSSSSQAFSSHQPSIPTTPPHRHRPAPGTSTGPTFQAPSRHPAYHPHHHRRTASSSSVLQFMTGPSLSHQPASPSPSIARRNPSSATPDSDSPRFSRLLSTVLGSPFLTTSDLPTGSGSVEMEMMDASSARPSSPTPSVDFSIIDIDLDNLDVQFSTNTAVPGGYPTRRSRHWPGHGRSLSSSVAGMSLSRSYANDFARGLSDNNPAAFATGSRDTTPARHAAPSPGSLKSILPRIWDALSSPGRALSFHPSFNMSSNNLSGASSTSSSRAASPSSRRALNTLSQSWYHLPQPDEDSERQRSTIWSTYHAKGRGKSRAGSFFSRNSSRGELSDDVNYSELDPLDGEEGELIDDEACFVDIRAVTGIDILGLLPPEIALQILILLCPPPLDSSAYSPTSSTSRSNNSSLSSSSESSMCSAASNRTCARSNCALSPVPDPEIALHAVLACRSVSRTWRRLSSDNAVWRAMFLGRWGIDLAKATPEAILRTDFRPLGRESMGPTWDYDFGRDPRRTIAQPLATPNAKRRGNTRDRSHYLSPHRISYITSETPQSLTNAPLQLDWRVLYRERLELDMRWAGIVPRKTTPAPTFSSMFFDSLDPFGEDVESKENIKPWEPAVRKMNGHTDSVYCLEFDSQRIVTGSRDRTIKVWSLKTGQILGTFRGVHNGSVLCLKFERDWDRWASGSGERKGTLVSGSSDCSICVWDLELGDVLPGTDEREVKAEVRAILKGHEGGVLDIRMDEKWIVSCSKDASIRVWDRHTLEPVRVLRGHEGPVNAIGFQDDKVVSASGDGKMILWDIVNGERIRTFEGHDRGLACIEFKGNLIVSGSNDCKIKVWDPWTGECLRTLPGHEALVRALSFDPRTGRLVSVSYDKNVKVWDLRTGKLIREFQRMHTSHIFDVKFDVARIVTTSHDHQIIELDFSAGLDTSLFI